MLLQRERDDSQAKEHLRRAIFQHDAERIITFSFFPSGISS
jgi:hypothetical protein